MYVAPPFRLRLPNLQPRSARFLIQGNTVTFAQKVTNVGATPMRPRSTYRSRSS